MSSSSFTIRSNRSFQLLDDDDDEFEEPVSRNQQRAVSTRANEPLHSGDTSKIPRIRKEPSTRTSDPTQQKPTRRRSRHRRRQSTGSIKSPATRSSLSDQSKQPSTRALSPISHAPKPRSDRPSYTDRTISIEEFKAFLDISKQTSRHRVKAPKNTVQRQKSLTIGASSAITSSVHRNSATEASTFSYPSSKDRQTTEGSSDFPEKPPRWKTTFDIDAPRAPLTDCSTSVSPSPSVDEDEEIDGWNSIDDLLNETRSVDGSAAYSTSDILPKATVDAMRSNRKQHHDKTESSLYKQSLRIKPKPYPKSRKKSLKRSTRSLDQALAAIEKKDGKMTVQERNPTSGSNLFEVFIWSDKQNVDELRERNRKLNRRPQSLTKHIELPPPKNPSDQTSMPSLANFTAVSGVTNNTSEVSEASTSVEITESESKKTKKLDDESTGGDEMLSSGMPSFANFTAVSGVTQDTSLESSRVELAENESKKTKKVDNENEEDDDMISLGSNLSSLGRDGLVLDKGVDDYIRSIQSKLRNLPTIVEDNCTSMGVSSARRSFIQEDLESLSPACGAAESSELDQLHSLHFLSASQTLSLQSGQEKQKERRASDESMHSHQQEKKEHRSSLGNQVKNIIREIRTSRGKSTKRASGDEEKYFPKKEEKTQFKANQCLLNEVEDF